MSGLTCMQTLWENNAEATQVLFPPLELFFKEKVYFSQSVTVHPTIPTESVK